MEVIELTQGKVALIDDIDYVYLMKWRWCALPSGHNKFRAMRWETIDGKRTAFYMHRVLAEQMGLDIKGKMVDHKDQYPLNNQRYNLRAATNGENQQNRGVSKRNKTGVKGVFLTSDSKMYQAEIIVDGKKHYLGRFDTIPKAAAVIKKKREELVGEFACN